MSKLPSMQFYPGDWRKDPGVQALDYETRGIWLELILLMFESKERGKLTLNGKPMPDNAVASILGLSIQKWTESKSKLIDYGVASLDEDGAIICRRMLRDEENRKQRSIDGSTGGNPALTKKYNDAGFVYAIERPSDGAIKIGIAKNVENRLYKLRYATKENLNLIAYKAVEDMGLEESKLHETFSSSRLNGEWFTLNGKEKGKLILSLKSESRASRAGARTEEEKEDEGKEGGMGETKRPRNLLFDAIHFHFFQNQTLSRGDSSRIAKMAAELKQRGATPEQVPQKIEAYRKQNPDWVLTPEAVVKHWPNLQAPKAKNHVPSF